MREGYWDSIVVECEVLLVNDLLSEKENAFYTLALAVTTGKKENCIYYSAADCTGY